MNNDLFLEINNEGSKNEKSFTNINESITKLTNQIEEGSKNDNL